MPRLAQRKSTWRHLYLVFPNSNVPSPQNGGTQPYSMPAKEIQQAYNYMDRFQRNVWHLSGGRIYIKMHREIITTTLTTASGTSIWYPSWEDVLPAVTGWGIDHTMYDTVTTVFSSVAFPMSGGLTGWPRAGTLGGRSTHWVNSALSANWGADDEAWTNETLGPNIPEHEWTHQLENFYRNAGFPFASLDSDTGNCHRASDGVIYNTLTGGPYARAWLGDTWKGEVLRNTDNLPMGCTDAALAYGTSKDHG